MTADQLKKAQEQAPFKSFTVYLSDQRRFEIPHPDFLWVLPGGRTIANADENGAAELIELVHVTSLISRAAPRNNAGRPSHCVAGHPNPSVVSEAAR